MLSAFCSSIKFFKSSSEHLKQIYATSYGLFSGLPTNTAIIRFTGLAARYAQRETWHPKQKLKKCKDGSVQLALPFNKPQELIKEILSWGNEAEIIAPPSLRHQVAGILETTAKKYNETGSSPCT